MGEDMIVTFPIPELTWRHTLPARHVLWPGHGKQISPGHVMTHASHNSP
jgi:hypothetical protein